MRTAILTRGDLFPTWHGAAVKIVRTAEALAAAGDHVVVVSEDRDRYWRVSAGGWSEIPYGRRFRAFQEWPVLRNQERAARWCARVGYPADEHLLYRAVFDPSWWARAVYVGLRERIDVFQAEFPGYAAPARIAATLLGGRSLAVMHNVEFDRLAQTNEISRGSIRRIRAVELALLRAVDTVVAVSELDRRRAVDAGVPPEHVSVVPHGVDVASYRGRGADLRVRYGLADGPVVFFHGTLHYAPNAEAVRFIASQLAPRLPRGAVLVAGMTPPRELESDNLRFCGPVEDLAAHIEAADLCICPIFAGGGTRMKLLEYFAAGKAVVSTAIGAEGLEVEHGRELVLAEAPEFANAVLDLLADPPRRRRLGRAARAYARARDWSAVAGAYRRIHRGERVDFVPRPMIEAHLPSRTPSKPLTLLFLVNRGCNLRCSFCDLWSGKEQVAVGRALALFDEAVRIGTRSVVLTGGEPTMHPGLAEIARGAKARGLGVNITTNGTLADRVYDRLAADSLSFSIDGLEGTHDRLRGGGAHAKTWRQLRRWRHAGGAANVYFTVNRENVRELVSVWEEARSAGAGFDFWPVNDAPELALRPEDADAWRAAVAHIARFDAAIADRAHYYGEALRYHAGERVPMRCLGLVDQYGVTFNGDLLPCCVWDGKGLVVGNVFETPLSELWASDAVQSHREHLFGEGCAAGCYNHSLYEFTASTGLSHRIAP